MSSLGFYSVCPATDQYVLGAPLYKKAKVNLANGKTIELTAPDNSDENRYVQSLKINGKAYGKNYFTHELLLRGAKLQYQMSDKPNTNRGTQASAYPYSFSDKDE